jgi:hypothetical protein
MPTAEPRPVRGPETGTVVEVEEARGLDRHYERRESRSRWTTGDFNKVSTDLSRYGWRVSFSR